jgi:phospholipid/cholesterol/gamma-HCH transport system substrate-binding protein
MEHEANYVAVGAFTMLLIAMAVGFVIWYSDARDTNEYHLYEIYFSGSVSGLDRGSPVRYLGVDVGRVRSLNIARNDPTRVRVIAEIADEAPVSSGTRASLGLQGVTGLLFINLKEAEDQGAAKTLTVGERYPIIDSVPSDFDALLATLPALVGRANNLLDRFSLLVSDNNLSAISGTLNDVRSAARGLPRTAENIDALVADISATVAQLNAAAGDVREISSSAKPQVAQVLERVEAAASSLATASKRIDTLVDTKGSRVASFADTGLDEFEQLMRDGRGTAKELRELVRSLRENPSQLVYEPPDRGVEIPR